MSITIKNKRSAVASAKPTGAQLDSGEIAVNYSDTDPALYIKDSTGAVIRIAGNGAVGGGEWDRTGTEVHPKTAGDDVFTSGDVKVGGTTGTPKISLKADGTATAVDAVVTSVKSAMALATDSTGKIVSATYTYPGGRKQTLQSRLEQYVSVEDFGAVGDGVTDDTAAIQAALDGAPDFAVLLLGSNKYVCSTLTINKPITITSGLITVESVRIKSSFVTFKDIEFTSPSTSGTADRALQILAYDDNKDYENIKVLNCAFKGYFYSTDFRGREYAAAAGDPANQVVKNTLIDGCTSTAQAGRNSGHWQHCGITNAKVVNCSTYGGQQAASYNFINGNGFIVVANNYDEGNSYGSLEIENNDSSFASVVGNTFGHRLWIDDTSYVSVVGNNVHDAIRISCEDGDISDISITGNTCNKIELNKFGATPSGGVINCNITGNTIHGDRGYNSGFFVNTTDASKSILFANNVVTGTFTTSAILISRKTGSSVRVINNTIGGTISASPAVGSFIEYGNTSTSIKNIESTYVSDLLVPDSNYLTVPGWSYHGSKAVTNVSAGASADFSFTPPSISKFDYQKVRFDVLFRDKSTGKAGTFTVDCIRNGFAHYRLEVGTPYGAVGLTGITVANGASDATQYTLVCTNSTADVCDIAVTAQTGQKLSKPTNS